jgi:hypothetical protein
LRRSSLDESVNFGTNNDSDIFIFGEGEIEFAVTETARGKRFGFLGGVEGVGVVEVDSSRRVFANDLEGEVLVDVGSFEGEGGRRVEGIFLVLERRVGSVLVDRGVI